MFAFLLLFFQDGLRGGRMVEEVRYHALLIGVQKYQSESIPDLETPLQDIRKLSDVLMYRYGFDRRQIRKLTDEQATEKGIRKAFENLNKQLGSNDYALIYFAGHGLEGEASSGYWIPYNARADDPSGYISNSDILGYVNRMRAKHVLVVSDSCFSGSVFSDAVKDLVPQNLRGQVNTRSRWAFTSGDLMPVADRAAGSNHSVFAKHLLRVLENSSEPYLTANKINGWISDMVFRESKTGQITRCGRLSGDEGGAFVFWNRLAVKPNGETYGPPWLVDTNTALSRLKETFKNRTVWVVGGSNSLCRELTELGMNVDCEPEYLASYEPRRIVIRCREISEGDGADLRDYLKLSSYELTHDSAIWRHCGDDQEIVIFN